MRSGLILPNARDWGQVLLVAIGKQHSPRAKASQRKQAGKWQDLTPRPCDPATSVGAFGLQWGIVAAMDACTSADMAYTDAFKTTFAVRLAVPVLAFGWFLVPVRRVSR